MYPLPFKPPSHLPPYSALLVWYRAPFEFPEPYSEFLLATYFTYGNVSFHVTLSIHLTPYSPLSMSISLFSMSVSPLLSCKSILQYQFSRCRIRAFSSVQLLSHVRLFATPWTAACQASQSFTISWSLLKFMSIMSVMPSNHLILCHSLLLLPSMFPSIRVFSNVLTLLIRWPKYWSFSFSISPSNEYSGLISFRIYWFDRLAFQGTLKSLLHQTCCYCC